MRNFTFYSPTFFAFGKDTEKDAGKYVRRFGGTKVLIHYGGGSVVRSGLLDRVKASLEEEGLPYVVLGGVKPNPRSGLVYEGIDLCRKEGVDFVLAVGGGSTIDSSKAIAAGTVYDGDFWDFYSGKLITEALLLTMIHEGPRVIENPDDYEARANIMWPYQTACGITDIMAHLYERYLTNTRDVEVTDRLIEALLLTMIHEGPRVIENPDDYEARANIMWAGMMAHNNSCGVGRTQDWNSHNIEHELSAEYDCAHGAGLAVTMPAVFSYVMEHDVMRFAKAAVRVWGCQMDFDHPEKTAKAGIEAFRQFLISLGMPKNFAELGAKEEDIPKLVHTLCYGDGRKGSIRGFVTLNEEDCTKIYKMMV